MAKKKKTKTSSDDDAIDDVVETQVEYEPITIPSQPEEWVTLDLRLLNWNFMDFKLRVRTTTHLFVIKRKIEERHGRIAELKICKEQFCERNEMTDEMKTLQDYDVAGSPETEPETICLVYYDFKPCDHADPLLLVS